MDHFISGQPSPSCLPVVGDVTGIGLTIEGEGFPSPDAGRIAVMHAVTDALAEANTLAQAAPRIVRILCEGMSWDGGTCWIVDTEIDALKRVGSWHTNEAVVDEPPAGACGILHDVWRKGQAAWLSDALADAEYQWNGLARLKAPRSTAAFPLCHAGRTLGVVEIHGYDVKAFNAPWLECLKYIGRQMGQFHIHAVTQIRLRNSEKRYADTVELAPVGIAHVDEAGRIVHANRWLCDLLGYTLEELAGRSVKQISHPEDVNVADGVRARLRAGEITSFQAEKRYLRKDGAPVWVQLTITVQRDTLGMPLHDIAIFQDISGRKQAEARVQYLASHDSLTGLPNRTSFSDILNHTIESSRRDQCRFAVLFIDLDRFKFINDSLGHEAGDTLLRTLSRRFKETMRSSDMVARLGGDEFVMLARNIRNGEQATIVAQKLLAAATESVRLHGQDCQVSASIGIAIYPDDANDEQSLMAHADAAMYQAKAAGKNNFQFYDQQIETRSRERLALESHLRRALEGDEFSLHYQPKLASRDRRITGMEALLRWHNGELGQVSPGDFIPFAEETGLILAIGRWALRNACAQSVAWQHAGLPPMRVAVNLSARQLGDPGLVPLIRETLAETGLCADLLELEVTESSVMHNVEHARRTLEALKYLGVHLAIDDFGTGYSSLAYLKRFPIDTLKIDRSFIQDLPGDAEDRAITEAIIAMGRALNLTVVAEGVETAEQEAFLIEHGCGQLQGYLYSRPVSADHCADLIKRFTSRA